MSNDVSATDLSVASDLPEVDVQIDAQASVEVQADSAPASVPVEVVVVGSSDDVAGDAETTPTVEVSAQEPVSTLEEADLENSESEPVANSSSDVAEKVQPVADAADKPETDKEAKVLTLLLCQSQVYQLHQQPAGLSRRRRWTN